MTNERHGAIPGADRETDRARATQTTSRAPEAATDPVRSRWPLRLASSLALCALLVAACSGKENPTPGDEDPITPTPTTGGSSGKGSGGGAGAGPVGSGGGTGGAIFEEPNREECSDEPDGEQPNSHPASHRGTPCWNVADCKIVSREQVINQCNSKGSSCFPFTRSIEGYTPGDPLPPL